MTHHTTGAPGRVSDSCATCEQIPEEPVRITVLAPGVGPVDITACPGCAPAVALEAAVGAGLAAADAAAER